jgi:hypothetical protein
MTKYIMKYSKDICTIDTDGIKMTCELSDAEIGPELGQMKFEGEFKESVFIAPKVYGGILTDNNMVVKVKGLKPAISYWLLKTLLYSPTIQIHQDKWYRDFSEATIHIIDQPYTLTPTDNKRELIFDSCGKLIGTRPYNFVNGNLIHPPRFILYYLQNPYSIVTKLIASPKILQESPSPALSYHSVPNVIYLPPVLDSPSHHPDSSIKHYSSPGLYKKPLYRTNLLSTIFYIFHLVLKVTLMVVIHIFVIYL